MAEPPHIEDGSPKALHAEITILGAMLVEPVAIEDAKDLLKPSDFFLSSNQMIFRSIIRLEGEGTPVDIVTVSDDLRKRHELDSIGGLPYLASLSEGLPRKLNVDSYVRIVIDTARKRDILNLSEVLGNAARANEDASDVLVARAKGWLEDIEDDSNHAVMESVGAYILREQPDPQSMFTVNAKSLGLLTPWMQVNTLTCGFQPGELVIIAGRPSMGKTALALNLLEYVTLRSGKKAALFSTEMSMDSMLNRLYCSIARVDGQRMKTGSLTNGERSEIVHARDRLIKSSLFISDKRSLTHSQIRSKAVRLHRDEELDAIVVDQLSGVSRADCKERDKHQKVGEQTRAFKELGQELGIPVIVLNQLTRGSTDRKDSRPMLSDLKESGSLEEDADVVAFVHRPGYFDRSDLTLSGKGEIIIAKNRNGPVGTADVDYNESLCTWRDSDQEQISY